MTVAESVQVDWIKHIDYSQLGGLEYHKGIGAIKDTVHGTEMPPTVLDFRFLSQILASPK